MDLVDRLHRGLDTLGIDAAEGQRQALLGFLDLLQKWNRTYNLTAIRDPGEMVSHHLLDSLAVLPVLEKSALVARRSGDGFRLADVGSGAGLPGLVLAIMRPDWRILSIDKVDKKAAFQRQVCIELALGNVEVSSERVERLLPESVDAAISRAFAELGVFIGLAGHLPVAGGALYAMKGVRPEGEMARLPAGWRSSEVVPLQVPGLEVRRHLVVLERG